MQNEIESEAEAETRSVIGKKPWNVTWLVLPPSSFIGRLFLWRAAAPLSACEREKKKSTVTVQRWNRSNDGKNKSDQDFELGGDARKTRRLLSVLFFGFTFVLSTQSPESRAKDGRQHTHIKTWTHSHLSFHYTTTKAINHLFHTPFIHLSAIEIIWVCYFEICTIGVRFDLIVAFTWHLNELWP